MIELIIPTLARVKHYFNYFSLVPLCQRWDYVCGHEENNNHYNYGIEYINANGNKDGTFISIEKKYTQALATQLRAVSGKQILEDKVGSANE